MTTYLQKRGYAKVRYRTEAGIRHFLTKNEPGAEITPIESHETKLGIPDLFVQTKDLSLWVELKSIKREVVNSFSPPWRPGQINWAKRHKAKNGYWILLIEINGELLFSFRPLEKYSVHEMFLFTSFTDVDFITLVKGSNYE